MVQFKVIKGLNLINFSCCSC